MKGSWDFFVGRPLNGFGTVNRFGNVQILPYKLVHFSRDHGNVFRGYNDIITHILGGLRPSFFIGFCGSKGKQWT